MHITVNKPTLSLSLYNAGIEQGRARIDIHNTYLHWKYGRERVATEVIGR